jgi:hypothetical protein
MVKRSIDAQLLPSPGLKEAPVLDLMCSHFVLTLAAKQGSKFNVRRDLNGLLSLAGRHLVWPAPTLARLRCNQARSDSAVMRRCPPGVFHASRSPRSTISCTERTAMPSRRATSSVV